MSDCPPASSPPCPPPSPQAAKKAAIQALVTELESVSPVTAPTDNLQLVAGDWRLLYSTITITVRGEGEEEEGGGGRGRLSETGRRVDWSVLVPKNV